MAESDLCFSSSSSKDSGFFKLLELPPDLCKLIESAADSMTPLRDDAVVIRDQINEILELTPSVPKLHTLTALLRGREYDDGQEDDDIYEGLPEDTKKYTYEDALRNIQASDAELDRGLKDRHILNIHGELRPIAPSYLNRLLELVLNGLVALSLSYESASVERLSSSLADDHDVPRAISTQVISWFGSIKDGKWKMDVNPLIKEVGLGVLRQHRVSRACEFQSNVFRRFR
ncbi:hypothetical protein DXG03_000342 [Asterophora parasitica]|uniref:Uncharacterized protein n=1 Tax=Asterophora parasitica TaxID=117018 RepID=A0A9P7GI51_9AGAR|nr:hypothetical protein DXG03_000342 [Asterophora parasitica]